MCMVCVDPATSQVRRSFVEGDLVLRHVPRRRRSKSESVWSAPLLVKKVVGDRNYIVTDGGRDFVLHVDTLRHFVLPPTDGWNIPEEFWQRISANWQVEKNEFDGFGVTLSELLDMDWAGKKIYVGFHLRACEQIWKKALREKPALLMWGVPELPCFAWYKDVVRADGVRWMVVNQSRSRLQDVGGDEVGSLAFKVWLVLNRFIE